MKKIIPYLLFLFCLETSAQNVFQKVFGDSQSETGTSIQLLPDSNYIISGYTNSFTAPFRDAYLIKVDSSGNVIWSNTYGGSNDEVCYYVGLTNTGGYVLTGGTKSFGAGENDLFIIRTNAAGNMLWSAIAGGAYNDYGWSAIQTVDRGFLISGFSETCLGGCNQGLLVKTDSAGTVQWTKMLGGAGSEALYGMDRTADGGYIVTGETSTNSFGSSDTWLIKLNANGDTVWTKSYGSATEESGSAVRQISGGGYIIAGDIHNAFNIHHASLLKTDSIGNLRWAKTFGNPDTSDGGEFGWDVHQLHDRGYILLGSTPAYNNSMQVFIVRTDSAGNMLWSKTYGGSQADDPWYSALAPDGGLAIIGATQSFGSGQLDVYLLKIDSLGFANGCNDSVIVPEVVTPVLQTGSGTTITTGMTSSNPLMVTNNPATIDINICTTVGTGEIILNGSQVLIYPNPFNTFATIQIYNARFTKYNFKLYDIMGREVLNLKLQTSNFKLERGNLQDGIYFYKVTGDKGQGAREIIGTGKIMIE
jgi:hypothetical protein